MSPSRVKTRGAFFLSLVCIFPFLRRKFPKWFMDTQNIPNTRIGFSIRLTKLNLATITAAKGRKPIASTNQIIY